MKKHIQGFAHGINQDLSINKYSNTNYFWAQNLRLVSKEALSTGALTNINGTLPKVSLGPAITITGICQIRNTLILFADEANGGRIYIWEHNTDKNSTNESPTLIYTHPDLDFSKSIRAVGRYETETIQKIYFTDGETFFKFLNIIPQTDESYPLNNHRSVDSLDIVSDVNFSNIGLELVTGGNLKAGKIQYAYQLYSKRGSESVFSPASDLVHLTDHDETQDSDNYHGSEVGTIVNKTVNVTINNLDNLFTRLRLVALEYTVYDQIPNVRIVGEYNIENKNNLTISDTGLSIGELTIEEFRFIQNDFYPKSIDIKDNYLFAANIKNSYFEISDEDFDARAFRFNKSRECKVWNGDTEVTINSNWNDLPPQTQELYNKFNDWNADYVGDTGSVQTYKYKYQSDGSTIGGEGPNISYKFTTERVLIDSFNINTYTGNNGMTIPYNRVGVPPTYESHANPLSKVGYKRDEVYRFGIVFFDKKGRPGFVKWIGDIRMPDNKDMPFIHYNSSQPNNTYAEILGIEFTVNTANIDDKISGYQIVRAERTSADKTILGQGIIASMVNGGRRDSDEDHMYSLATTPNISDCLYEQVRMQRWSAEPSQYNSSTPQPYTDEGTQLTNEYMEFVSPETVFNKKNFTTSDAYLELEGYINYSQSTAITGPRTSNNDWLCTIQSEKYKSFSGYPDLKYRKPVDSYKIYTPKSISNTSQPTNDATIHILEDGKIFNNQCTTNTPNDTRFGMRGSFGLCKTNSKFDIPSENVPWNGYLGGDDWDNRVFLGSYRINKGRSLYGGSSFEARSATRYFKASEFVIANDITSIDVFNGDTYINYFFYLRSMWDESRKDLGQSEIHLSDDIIDSVVIFPVESSINLDLRLDEVQEYYNWGFIRGDWHPNYKLLENVQLGVNFFGNSYPVDVGNLYRYNSAYSVTDKSKEFFPKPFDFESTLTNDTRITASEKKINGEYTDSWTKFKFANNIDVDSGHYGITKIITFKNNLFFIQPTGVGIASVNARSLIQDNQPGQLTLGNSGILTRVDYLTEKSGSEFYEGIVTSDDYLYYIDGKRKRINKLVPGKEEAISIIKGIDSFLDEKEFNNVVAGFDRGYNEVIFAIDYSTIAFSETANAFISSYSFNPKLMFSIDNTFYSVSQFGQNDESPWLYEDQPDSKIGYIGDSDEDENWDFIVVGPGEEGYSEVLYQHNVGTPGGFYGNGGENADSYITLILNPESNTVCYFDNLDLRTESISDGSDDPDDIFYKMEAKNSYQSIIRNLEFLMNQTDNTKGYKYNTGSIRRIGRVWRTPIMGENVDTALPNSNPRMLDTYLIVTLRYRNGGNKFKIHDITTYYRSSNH